ncbi:FG-GAP-like repeat-containing protein [Streptomyces sp. NPDC050842]|uniref:FG-GAP-like repeat-containing protein n=1 Tax=Streptomyces sp. NPDC050842 TaxID=3365636 RepID=UPI00379DC1A3
MTTKRSRLMWTTTSAMTAALATLLTTAPASALTGADASTQFKFVAKINVGDKTACTGVLVAPQWVLTAASCFTAAGIPTAGKPSVGTTVTVGRTDLTQTGGSVQQAVHLVPHVDRDLVMVRLGTKIPGATVAPVRIAAAPAAAGEELTKAGFGRTKTEWVPNKLHTGTFTVASATDAAVNLNGSDTATVCQGDAGGPAVRMVNGTPELVSVNSRSWQGGCLGTDPAEVRTNAVDTRVDDLRTWITNTAFQAQGDMTGDRIADLVSIWGDGTLHRYTGSMDGLSGQRVQQWGEDGWSGTKHLLKGDFTNDGRADVLAVWPDGTLRMYKTDTAGNIGGWNPPMWGGTTWSSVQQMTTGDFNGDGRTDILAVWADGTLHLYKGDGNGNITQGVPAAVGGNVGSLWGGIPQFIGGDFDRDGFADIMAIWTDGTLHFYKNKGDGNFNTQLPAWGGNTWSGTKLMAGDDYSADGAADLMTVWPDGDLHLYKGNGQGNISPSTIAWGGGTWASVKHIA